MPNNVSLLCAILCLCIGAVTPVSDVTAGEGLAHWNLEELLNLQIKSFSDKRDEISKLNRTQMNSLIRSVQEALDMLKDFQNKAYIKTMSPSNCTLPLVPSNGGLVCVHLGGVQYCKPMCNQGYDFAFLRRSRVYEECGKHTGFSWTTQYVGGRRLAECIATPFAISGVSTAYFSDAKCQQIVATAEMEQKYVTHFLGELKNKTIENGHEELMDFVVCGD
ncbi:hypothetical protein FKM82_015323 [Ascaphus truei]